MTKKVVFITGGGRGIGKAITKKFQNDKYYVAIGYKLDKSSAMEVCSNFSNSFIVQVDISNRTSIKRAIKKITDYFNQPISVLINNAAIAQEKPFLKISDRDWENMLVLNLQGPFRLIQEILPPMIKKKWGRIINISSIGGQWGGQNQVHYAASKAGLINLTRSIAKLYSSNGITSNAVSPGLVLTSMAKKEIKSKKGKEKIKDIPIGRIATSEEIANTVLFLASEESSYITGQTINLNGGMYFD
jgi:NAD(P)-dependent dehydrogenase (short-subunit alcohol dehydrogenase family)